jgi:mannitol/fructose-specific phosphotransferase system IIA component (Ntr-type)
MKLQEFVVEQAIIPNLQSTQRDDVIRELVDALIENGAAPKTLRDELVKLILDREKHGSTGFGKGAAVPHVKHEKIKKIAAAIGISRGGLDFRALDKAPVYMVILILSPATKPQEHLQAMEKIFSNLQNDTFRRFLRQANSVQDVKTLLEEADNQQLQA